MFRQMFGINTVLRTIDVIFECHQTAATPIKIQKKRREDLWTIKLERNEWVFLFVCAKQHEIDNIMLNTNSIVYWNAMNHGEIDFFSYLLFLLCFVALFHWYMHCICIYVFVEWWNVCIILCYRLLFWIAISSK